MLFLARHIGGRKAAAAVWHADGPHIPIDLFIQTILRYPAANEDSDISQAYLYKLSSTIHTDFPPSLLDPSSYTEL